MRSNDFAAFREGFFLTSLIGAFLLGYFVKALVVFTSFTEGHQALDASDLLGMSLSVYASNVSWNEVSGSLVTTFVATTITTIGLCYIRSKKIAGRFMAWERSDRLVRRELYIYVSLFMLTAPLAVSTIGMFTFLVMHVVPLLMLNLANPLWGETGKTLRLFAVGMLFTFAYLSLTSKTTIVYLLLALGLGPLYSRRQIVLISFLAGILFLLYPYLNVFRGMSSDFDSLSAIIKLATRIESDVSSTMSLAEMFQRSIGMILDRITGLDGVLLSLTAVNVDTSSAVKFSQSVTGIEGKGVSAGLFGSLIFASNNIIIASILFVAIVFSSWYFVRQLNIRFWSIGLLSIQPYLCFEVIQMLIGGFRTVDVKLTAFLLISVIGMVFAKKVLVAASPSGKAVKSHGL